MERCLGLAYVNEGWEDDGEKWRSRSGRRERGGRDREARMEGDVLNDREQGGEKSVHNYQHSEKHPWDVLFNLPEHVFMALKLCTATPSAFQSPLSISLSLSKSPHQHTHTHTHSDKRMNHPLRLLIKTIIEQQREQDKRKGRGGAAACYQILLSSQRVSPTTSSKCSSRLTWAWTWNKRTT